MTHQVFFSYSSVDEKIARAISEELDSANIQCWLASLHVGAQEPRWTEAISKALKSARVVLLLFSKHANESDEVASEVELAFSQGTLLIVLCLDSTKFGPKFNYRLAGHQVLKAPGGDISKLDLPAQIRALLQAPPPPSNAERPTRTRRVRAAFIALTAAVLPIAALIAYALTRGTQAPELARSSAARGPALLDGGVPPRRDPVPPLSNGPAAPPEQPVRRGVPPAGRSASETAIVQSVAKCLVGNERDPRSDAATDPEQCKRKAEGYCQGRKIQQCGFRWDNGPWTPVAQP